MSRRRLAAVAVASLTLVVGLGTGAAAGDPPGAFELAAQGCPMAHCDSRMSDTVRLGAPARIIGDWLDPAAASISQGLGCSANGKVVACTSGDRTGTSLRPSLRVYDAEGGLLWHSGTWLNSWAWTSAPMVARDSSIIAADDAHVVRFGPDGGPVWSTPTPGGRPISPTQTEDGTIVLATAQGPISAFDPRTGELLGALDLTDRLDGVSGRYDTRNTPAVRGNRVYVSTEFEAAGSLPDPNHHAALFAIDVDPAAPPGQRLRIAWRFEFGARSGASPLRVGRMLVFDGDREHPDADQVPRFFGVRDLGPRPQLVWQYELGGPGVASAAQDPRGGAWVFAFGDPLLRRISIEDGTVLQTIDVDAAIGEPGIQVPYSAMSIAEGTRGHPVMILTARALLGAAYVTGLDLVTGKAVWKYKVAGLAPLSTPMGQFPILRGPGGRRTVVFSTKGGVHAVVGLR